MTSLLVFFPDYRSANPYQTLLHEHAGRELHPRPGSIADALALQRQRRLGERVIFHLHWEDGVYRNEPTEAAAWQAAQAFLADLEALLDAGGHLVWTLHNEQPHDGRYLPVHKALCEKLGLLADVVHVHSLAASAFARSRLRIDPGRLALIHHGSYTTLYPRLATPAARSRAALGLAKARRVLLLFGAGSGATRAASSCLAPSTGSTIRACGSSSLASRSIRCTTPWTGCRPRPGGGSWSWTGSSATTSCRRCSTPATWWSCPTRPA
jgi:hypothetical protein